MQAPKRPEGQKSRLLDAAVGWFSAKSRDGKPLRTNSVAEGEDLRLVADPRGPLALTSSDGSVGRLTVPSGIALAPDGTVYLLSSRKGEPNVVSETNQILRFDAAQQRFVALPEIGGVVPANVPSEPPARQFRSPQNIAIVGHTL